MWVSKKRCGRQRNTELESKDKDHRKMNRRAPNRLTVKSRIMKEEKVYRKGKCEEVKNE